MSSSKSFQIGDYQIQLDGWGKNKKTQIEFDLFRDNNSYNSETDRCHVQTCEKYIYKIIKSYTALFPIIPDIWMYGQDSFGIYHSPKEQYLVIVNADGHSNNGEDIAFYSVLIGINRIVKEINKIKEYHTNKSDLEIIFNRIFQEIDNYILYDFPETNNKSIGGSTLTINIKFVNKKNNLVSIVSNIGDSIFIRANNNEIIEETIEFNCDKLDSYNKYVELCNNKNITPKDVYLARYNLPNKFKIDWMLDKNRVCPIKPFILTNENGVFLARENIKEMKAFYENAPIWFKTQVFEEGGPQSIRNKEFSIKEYKEGRYPSSNYGNTIQGICQCLSGSSIGDKKDKYGRKDIMLSNTNISLYSNDFYKENNIEIIGTDGFFDTIIDTQLKQILETTTKIEDIKKELINMMVKSTTKYKWGNKWDDISLCVIKIQKRNKSKSESNVSKKQKKRINTRRRKRMNKYNNK